ncbi:MAG: NapC/NirT family cytochrome c [Pseudomonadota bacterium]
MIRWFTRFLVFLSPNWIGLAGTALATASALCFLAAIGLQALVGSSDNPYVGILTYLILPVLFVLGLLLIPAALWLERTRRKGGRRIAAPFTWSAIDFNQPRNRRFLAILMGLTVANLLIIAIASYKGFHVMESVRFCGTTCHTAMEPEYTSYLGSPHAHVKCVECHIGAGAGWFVKSKLSGSWQVIATVFRIYPRPIASPVKNLRPARETCEECHWPERFEGDRLKIISRSKSDEKNTETKTVLLLKVGGIRGIRAQGIHWHVDARNRIRYLGDESRNTIYDVELTKADGSKETFAGAEKPPAGQKNGWRQFDCIDCHNRPTHVFRMPFEEVDLALQSGAISRALPYVRRQGIELLNTDYPSHEEARNQIRMRLEDFYRQNYPQVLSTEKDAIETAANSLGDAYSRNVFPFMKVTWGTHPNHLGHENYPGCQRCHDGDHKTAAGHTISADCDTCHALLAQEEENPKILTELQP